MHAGNVRQDVTVPFTSISITGNCMKEPNTKILFCLIFSIKVYIYININLGSEAVFYDLVLLISETGVLLRDEVAQQNL